MNQLIPTIDVQSWLKHNGFLPDYLVLSGSDGPATEKACAAALSKPPAKFKIAPEADDTAERARCAVEQMILVEATKYDLGRIDGIAGTRTLYALELYHNLQRDKVLSPVIIAGLPSAGASVSFPRQSEIRRWLGEPGTDICRVPMAVPFGLRMDGSLSKTAKIILGQPGAPKPINRIALHEKLHDSATKIFADILSHYGLERIHELGINQYAGSFNYRPMRGGKSLSMHSWGAAIDLDAQRNSLHETKATARFGRPEYNQMIDIFYDHGWISLGRERNFDWMHFQAPRL